MRVAAVTLVGLVAIGLVGCTPAPIAPGKSESPTIAFRSEEEALASARAAYLDYRRVAEAVLAGGGTKAGEVRDVATGELLKEEIAGDKDFAAKGYRATGTSTLVSFSIQDAKLSAPADSGSVVTAYACIDVSGVNVVDGQGTSVVSTSRPPRVGYEVAFDAVEGRLLPSRQDPWNSAGVCA